MANRYRHIVKAITGLAVASAVMCLIVCPISTTRAQAETNLKQQDLSGVELHTSGTNDDFSSNYMSDMGRKIKRQWTPSRQSFRQQATVGYTIGQDGRVSNLRILKSSNDDVYDKQAMQAIEGASPFERLPEATEKIEVQFSFDNKNEDIDNDPPHIGFAEKGIPCLPSLGR